MNTCQSRTISMSAGVSERLTSFTFILHAAASHCTLPSFLHQFVPELHTKTRSSARAAQYTINLGRSTCRRNNITFMEHVPELHNALCVFCLYQYARSKMPMCWSCTIHQHVRCLGSTVDSLGASCYDGMGNATRGSIQVVRMGGTLKVPPRD